MQADAEHWVAVAAADQVPDGEVRTFTVEGARVAIARADGKLYAIQDLCSHDDGPLGDGTLDGHAIQCPRHGAKFDIRTGAVLSMPAIVGVGTFPVTEKDGVVMVGVSRSAATNADGGDDW